MKKLVIMMVAMCVVAFSHAATISWYSSGNLVDSKGALATTNLGYDFVLVYLGNVVDTGTFSFSSGDDYNEIGGQYTVPNGVNDGAVFAVMAKDSAGKLYDLIYSDTEDVIETYTLSGMTTEPPAPADFEFAQNGDFRVDAEDVPEPTSALLLLLGVAGVALKRKQV